MLTIYDLKKQTMLTQPEFFDLTTAYDTLSGVSFVGSFKIIEQELLPRFKQIKLILGMEDQKTGQNLNQFFDLSRRTKELKNASEEFLRRITDETLQLHFTKDHLFHSKYFIFENETQFAIFNGSMNLTDKALHDNHEMMWLYTGDKSVAADQAIYQAHQQLFEQNFNQDSTEYLSRKLINQLHDKSVDEIAAVLTEATFEQLDNKSIQVHVKDIEQVVDEAKREQISYAVKPEVVQTVSTIYTVKGNRRRNKEQAKSTVKQLVYRTFKKAHSEEADASELYPRPMWSYQSDQLIVQDQADGLYHPLTITDDLVTRADVENFVKIIKSFRYNKIKDESQQALSAFVYLMTAPLIWKIRALYRDSNFSKSPDQVPVSMVLIGRGTTGKTLLVRDYFKPFIGDDSPSVQYVQINQGNGAHTNRAVEFLGSYLQSKRFVSPMIIDELNENFLHSKVATNAIKQWSNTLTDIHNVNVFAMNHNAGDRTINNLEEITKRVYYLSFEAGWKDPKQQRYDYNILGNSVNDHIYRWMTWHLNERLNDLTGQEEERLVQDYLYLTKELLNELLTRFGLADELADLIWQNYDYKVDRNRLTWKMLIKDDNFEHVAFTEGDDQRFSVSKAIFNNLKGSTYENINQTLDNYYNMFPRESGVALDQYDNGMVLDIDRFDHFVGEPLIRRYYEQLHQKENQQDQLTQLLKAQAQQSAKQAARQEKHDEMMLKAMEQLAAKKQQPKHRGIWSRWFKGDD